jgi:antitoxin YefM
MNRQKDLFYKGFFFRQPENKTTLTKPIRVILIVIISFLPIFQGTTMKIDTYIPVTRAKAKFLDMIRMLDTEGSTVAITRNGVPTAVMMSMDHYEAMQETMTILGDRDMMDQIRRSLDDIHSGRPLMDLEDL